MINPQLGPDIEIGEEVDLSYGRARRKSCPRLDAADRAIWFLGRPVLKMTLEGARIHDWETIWGLHDMEELLNCKAGKDFGEMILGQGRQISGVGRL